MLCSSCQQENRPDARFCLSCGAELSLGCPSCGRELPPAARFCDGCGAQLGEASEPAAPAPERDLRSYTPPHLAQRILTSKSALEGERKHVTVLFADLVDSTPLAASLGPEEMHALMDRCFQLMLEQVHRLEGTVNQFTGDGIMALFGAPIALEDAPRRAVMAALAIQRALEPLHEEVLDRHGLAFRMRLGIHSGMVVVGKIGDDLRMDYTAVGDTSNLADRLQGLARPGGVVISAATERLVLGFFDLQELRPVTLKGVTGPVRAFEVMAERPVRGRIEAEAATGLTTFVGRERQLDTLWAAFESAAAGRGQVVFLVGEAGIGKSRLRYEFQRRLADEPHGWLEGRCESNTRATAFHPIADAMRRAFGIEERDDDAAALAKIARTESDAGGELEWTLPFLRQLLSLPAGDASVAEMDAATRRSETFRALQARLLRTAEREPVVLVVEDLHWIDAASEEFLVFLADSVPASRLLLLFTFRPTYRHPFGEHSYHERLALQVLSEGEMATMAISVLDTKAVPEGLRRLIARKAEGNPFFVEEVTKSLLEEGALRREGGRITLTRDLADVSVPDSIQDVLMARIDRLEEEPKRAIQVASVIGRDFALRLLERISEAGERVPSVVQELRTLELINEKMAHPELAFMFKHALTHEVAYQSVLQQRRKALHQVVGRAIEDLYRDRLAEHYEALAHHFSLGEDWERALDYHEKASEKAAEAYANHTAAEHCRRALEITDRLGEHVPDERRRGLAERLGLACWLVSEFRVSGEAYRRAAGCSAEAADRVLNLGRASNSFHWGHEYGSARESIGEALSLAGQHRVPSGEALALIVDGFDSATSRGDLERFERLTTQALSLSKDNDEICGMALHHRGEIAEWSGEYRRAITLQEEGLEIGRRLRRPDYMVYSTWFLGKANCCLGRYGEAVAQLQQALELADRIGDRAWKTRLLNTLGWCFAEFGCHERAIRYNQRSTDLAREMVELALVPGAPELHGNAAINLAGNRIALGDLDAAGEHLEPIRRELEQPGDPWMRWRYGLHLRDGLARLALARGDPERARELADEELQGARKYRARKLEARALELRARALVTMDRRDDAAGSLREALEVARRIEYPPVTWRALSLQAELARRSGERSLAERYAGEARRLIEALTPSLPDEGLQRGLRAMADRLVDEPLAAYR